MPTAKTYHAEGSIHDTVKRLAEQAKYHGTVACRFEEAHYPSPAACKKAASILRNNFNAMKSRARRAMQKSNPDFPGPFDELGCYVDRTPTGWRVTIGTSWEGFTMTVENAETGEPITLNEAML